MEASKGLKSCPKMLEKPPNYRRQKSDKKQVPYCAAKILKATVQNSVTRADTAPGIYATLF
jgi:hypothetical protein